MSPSLKIIGSIVFLLGCGGCICTGNMWGHAVAKGLAPGRDVIAGGLVDRSSSPPQLSALVITYEDDYFAPFSESHYSAGAGPVFLIIPLDANGVPAWPFGYPGLEVHEHSWSGQLSPEQSRALRNVRFSEDDFENGYAAVHSQNFVSSKAARISATRGLGAHDSEGPLAAVVRLRIGVDSGEQVLALPFSQPRPERYRQRNIDVAVILTPPELLLDAVLDASALAVAPIALPLVYFHIIPVG
jgi:hypothetical protein